MKAAVYSGSRDIYDAMLTSAKSLIFNSDVDKIYFLIEDDAFPYELPKCIETINVSKQTYFRPDGPNMNSNYTYLSLMRAALAYIFSDLDVILSLDADTIIDSDISDIWDIPLGDEYYFAASKEAERSYYELLYTNTGVALYNLRKLRDGKAKEVIDVLNATKYKWLEQDVFNYLCQGHIYEMPSSYNVNDWTDTTDDKKIIHFAGHSDFRSYPAYLKYYNMGFEHRNKSVLIAVPTYENISCETFKSIYDIDKMNYDCEFEFIKGYGCANARNKIAQTAINDCYDYVLMIDSDMTVPKDILKNMLEDPKDVVLGCCAHKSSKYYDNLVCIYHDDGEYDYTHMYSIDELNNTSDHRIKVHGGGMACALIKTDVFKKLKYPWYKWTDYENKSSLSEDLYFCSLCRDKGIDIYADTRVRCGHILNYLQLT